MGVQIVKQPNGKYSMWSSVVDDFIAIDCTPNDIVDVLVEDERQRIEDAVKRIVRKIDGGGRPYHQFTLTFEQCLERIREHHGDDADSLKAMKQLGVYDERPGDQR